jgi:shikimate kinase
MNIVLTGPMGSGKTTTGKAVASALKMGFIDTDELIVKKTSMSIEEIFDKYGEEGFRKYEEQVIKEVSKLDNKVIATGGGVILNPKNMRRLRLNGVIINLRPPLETLYNRVKDKKRPLLKTKEDLRKFSEGRLRFYNNADFIIRGERVIDKVISIARMPQIRICACIAGDNPLVQIQKAVELGASMVELRLDLIPNPDIPSLLKESGLPVIATDKKNTENLLESIELGCDFVDIEIDSLENSLVKKARSKECKIIASLHNYEKTPTDFPSAKADFLKIATKINCVQDSKNLLSLLNSRKNLIVIGLGELGVFTRIIAPLLGSYLTYAYVKERTGEGQLSVKTMVEIYRKMGLR